MRADWTASGACTSGSIAHPKDATRRASGGAATTSTRRAERSRGVYWRLGAALRCQRGGHDGCGGGSITVERLAPAGERVARAIGTVVVGAGLFVIARAAGLG